MSNNSNYLSTPPLTPRGLNLAEPGTLLNQSQQIANQSAKKMEQKKEANVNHGPLIITNDWRKGLVNGVLHFQRKVNGEWVPANAQGNPLPKYSNMSRVRVKNSPNSIKTSNNDTPIITHINASKKSLKANFNKANGGKRSMKKKKDVCFSKKGKKSRRI